MRKPSLDENNIRQMKKYFISKIQIDVEIFGFILIFYVAYLTSAQI